MLDLLGSARSTREQELLEQHALGLSDQQASDYTFHSCRSGGTTALVASGATTEELQAAGGWRSSTVPYMYAQRDVGARLALARTIHNSSH